MSTFLYRKVLPLFNIPFLPVVIAPLILFAPIFLTGKVMFWGTPILQFVPWRAWAWETIVAGHLPLWNPLVGMGAPLLGNYQSAFLYPPNWLLWLLQAVAGIPGHAWGQAVLVSLHLVWAGIGMVLLARRLGLGDVAQTISSLAFCLSSYLVSRASFLSINAAVAWLPWVVFYATNISCPGDSQHNRGSFTKFMHGLIPLSLCIGMLLLAGHAQISWYTLLFSGVWVLISAIHVQGWRFGIRAGLRFAAAASIGVGLAAIQLFPTAEYLFQSQRAAAVEYLYALNYSFWPWRFLSLLAPDLFGNPVNGDYWFNVYYWEDAVYIGLLPILLAITAIISRKGKFSNREVEKNIGKLFLIRFLVGVVVVTFIFALGRYTPIFPFLYKYVPSFSMFQAPTRFSIIAVLALVLLAGIGGDFWRRPTGKGLYWTRLGIAGAFAVMLGSGVGWFALGDIRPTFIRAAALAGLWGIGVGLLTLFTPQPGYEKRSKSWMSLVALWLSLDLLVAGWGLNPAGPSELYNEDTRFVELVKEMTRGDRVYLSRRDESEIKYERFFTVGSFDPGEDWNNLRNVLLPNINMLEGISMVNNYDPFVPGRYERWMDFLTTRSSLELNGWLGLMGVGAIEMQDSSQPAGVRFEQTSTPGRFRWSTCARYAAGENEAWELATDQKRFSRSFDVLVDENVVLETSPSFLISNCQTWQKPILEIQSENPNQIIVNIETQQPGYLIQADLWYPGWKAHLDGEEEPLVRADTIFRAVLIPEGKHVLSIQYEPFSFVVGALVSGLTLCGMIVLGFLWVRKKIS